MIRHVAVALAGAVLLATALAPLRASSRIQAAGQTTSLPPFQFEVVSIKESRSLSLEGYFRTSPTRFTATNTPLRRVILSAYGLLDHQLIGAPEWTETPYDITATFPAGRGFTDAEAVLMLRHVLADRFRLVAHADRRELPAYSLVLVRRDGQPGPFLTPSTVDCARWVAEKRPQMGGGAPRPAPFRGQRPACTMLAGRQMISAGTQTLGGLAAVLPDLVRRPVIDRTGLAGTWDMEARWTPSGDVTAPASATPGVDVGVSIFTALEEHLGLRLEPTREPYDVLVVDSIARPTPD
jgi:uncharacterized protein (TIGR03435 family)